MKRIFACLAAVCLLAGLLAGCGGDGSGQGFRLPLAGEPAQLDPALAADENSSAVTALLFEGLTKRDDTGAIVPGAAEWTVSPDGLTYTFTLRESYWSTVSERNGVSAWEQPTRVTADDFVFGMRRAADPATRSELASRLDGIRGAAAVRQGQKPPEQLGVSAPDEAHVVIELEKRDDTFPERLASAPFYPCNRAFFEQTGGRYGLDSYILSNGAFYLRTWEHGQSLLLYKNERYHDAGAILPAAVRFVIGAEETPASVTAGTLDVARLAAEDVSEAEQAGLQTVRVQDAVRSLWMNTEDPVLCNTAVRQALRDSVEWASVYAFLEEAGEPRATGYVPPAAVIGNESCRTPQTAGTFSSDVTAARAALGKGLQELYPEQKTPALPGLTVLAAEDAVSADTARYLIQSWQKNLGLKISLQTVSATELAGRMRTGRYQLAVYTTTATGRTAGENLRAYQSAAGNPARWNDPAFAPLCQAVQTGSAGDLTRAEQYLRQACPSLPLSFPETVYGIAPSVTDLTVRPFGGEGGRFGIDRARRFD